MLITTTISHWNFNTFYASFTELPQHKYPLYVLPLTQFVTFWETNYAVPHNYIIQFTVTNRKIVFCASKFCILCLCHLQPSHFITILIILLSITQYMYRTQYPTVNLLCYVQYRHFSQWKSGKELASLALMLAKNWSIGQGKICASL
jgi:hypothetical protein